MNKDKDKAYLHTEYLLQLIVALVDFNIVMIMKYHHHDKPTTINVNVRIYWNVWSQDTSSENVSYSLRQLNEYYLCLFL